jgi:hypothetical protein
MKPKNNFELSHAIPHQTRSFLEKPRTLEPVLNSQVDTRNAVQKILRAAGDKISMVVVAAIILGMMVLCLPNAFSVWLEKLTGQKKK